MIQQSAKRIGGKRVTQPLFVLFLFMELYLLFMETRGNFANGLLFFIQEQSNSPQIILIIIIFLVNYYLGSNAGVKIINDKKNHWKIAIKSIITLIGIITAILVIAYIALGAPEYVWQSLIWVIVTIAVPITGVWLWAAYRIKLKA
jgi:hypothetical protein